MERNLGWAPAPTVGIYVIRPENADDEETGCMLYLAALNPFMLSRSRTDH